jgi:GTPase-activating protein BEM2
VLDLALSRTHTQGDGGVSGKNGLGDLRGVGRKGWSRSVDDLGQFPSTQTPPVNTSNIKLSASPPRDDSIPSPTKARIEAYRRNTPVSQQSLHPHYPFPTIQATSLSPTSPSSPSSSSPALSPANRGAVSPLSHSRSFSHVPFQSSKLASPSALVTEQPLLQAPPQPRNRAASSFEYERERDKDKATRSGFGFPFSAVGPGSKQVNLGPTTAVNLASSQLPPASLSSTGESKRTSQIVHYSGFLNRHPDSQPSYRSGHALSGALTKGWKPYKAILKGSKLYFYKPSSDRTMAIKELFPQGMEPLPDEPTERPETVPEEPEVVIRVPVKDKEDVKKRTRLYRGRAMHPELSLAEDGSVARGSSDALIHEAVFGTSFSRGDLNQTEDPWKRFASAVVLCLPRLAGRVKFENEFIRYASYLIGGADDEERGRLHARTHWLAEQYLIYQGGPADMQAWNTFRMDIFPSLPLSTTMSLQIDDSQHGSPDLDTFSPRPSQSRTLSTFAFVSAVTPPPRPSLSRPSFSQLRPEQNIWSTLEKEGLTCDVFFKLDTTMLARSLVSIHRSLLAPSSDPLAGADIIGREPHDIEEQTATVLANTPHNDFFGSDDNPHWLTRFIVVQILNVSGTVTFSNSPADAVQVSKTHIRSDIINKWLRVGEYCSLTGDRCSWKAIQAALCSRPIARLDKVWRRVEGSSLRSLDAWLKCEGHAAPGDQISTPWGGDVRERVMDLVQQARVEVGGKDDQWDASSVQEIFSCIKPVAHEFSQSLVDSSVDGQNDEISQLTRFWRSAHVQPPSRPPGLNGYLSQSLAAEPRQRGRFEPYHWQRPLNATSMHTLVPLLFAEHFPTVTLIDRDQIYRGKKESLEGLGSHPGLDEAQVSRMTRMKSSLDARRQNPELRSLESSKLLPSSEMGGTILRMHGGELLLLVPKSFPESSSRPPSSLETSLERPASQIRVTNPGIERKTSMARRSSLPTLSQRNSVSTPESMFEATLRVVVKAGTLDRLVDILISGFEGVSVAVADDNGEMPLREERTRWLKLDRNEFRATWWAVFRSFVTPIVLFEVCCCSAISPIGFTLFPSAAYP